MTGGRVQQPAMKSLVGSSLAGRAGLGRVDHENMWWLWWPVRSSLFPHSCRSDWCPNCPSSEPLLGAPRCDAWPCLDGARPLCYTESSVPFLCEPLWCLLPSFQLSLFHITWTSSSFVLLRPLRPFGPCYSFPYNQLERPQRFVPNRHYPSNLPRRHHG